MGIAGRVLLSEAIDTDTATGKNRVVLGCSPRGGAAAGEGSEQQRRVDVEDDQAAGEARDVMMTETETATIAESETEVEALTTNG
jgi:hypothetical protein